MAARKRASAKADPAPRKRVSPSAGGAARRSPAKARSAAAVSPPRTARRPRQAPVTVGDVVVAPGTMRRLELPVARLATQTQLSLPVTVVHGQRPGPSLWLSAAVHGDEINGVEIIRRVLGQLDPATLRGTVMAVPIVNVFGFINQSRYLPDRRDLNRSFPGSAKGSLAARLARLFMTEIVGHCSHGIDLHTGTDNRTNLPHVRADLTDPETRRIAEAFAPPLMMHSRLRDGSLREAATRLGIPVLLFEGGEARRFNEDAIETGVDGVMRVMAALEMRRRRKVRRSRRLYESRSSHWVRARRSGLLRLRVKPGEQVDAGQRIGVIADAFGERTFPVSAPKAGLVVSVTLDPLVSQGDALVHVAEVEPAAAR